MAKTSKPHRVLIEEFEGIAIYVMLDSGMFYSLLTDMGGYGKITQYPTLSAVREAILQASGEQGRYEAEAGDYWIWDNYSSPGEYSEVAAREFRRVRGIVRGDVFIEFEYSWSQQDGTSVKQIKYTRMHKRPDLYVDVPDAEQIAFALQAKAHTALATIQCAQQDLADVDEEWNASMEQFRVKLENQ